MAKSNTDEYNKLDNEIKSECQFAKERMLTEQYERLVAKYTVHALWCGPRIAFALWCGPRIAFALWCGPRIASLPLPRNVVRGDKRAVLQRKLMLLFFVGIVHTNLYNCIS